FGNAQALPPCSGGGSACFFVNDDNHIGVNTPAGGGTVDVTVIGSTLSSAHSSADLFTFVPPGAPTINAISPRSGPTFGGGGQVVLNGSNLSSVDSVTFGTNPPTVISSCSAQFGSGPCFSGGQENTLWVNGIPAS